MFLCVAAGVLVAQAATVTPDALLQRGIASYRASHYAEAAKDLKEAADAMLSQEQMQTYVNSGKFPNIEKFETALVYLTLAEAKLGRNEQAKEAVLRLETAERIEKVFARLPLEADAAEFPRIAARLVPGSKIGENAQLAAAAAGEKPAAPPPATPVEKPAAPVQTAQTTTTAPAPAPAAAPAPAPTASQAAAERDRAIAEAVAAERARMQKEADERVAAARREAEAQIAASQRAAEAQIAATRTQPARTDYLVRLRQADAYADNGQTSRADDIYVTIANAPDAPRDIVAEAGVGLYRISAFRDAVSAFRKLAPFARGEEDLRYYNAVSLYETGEVATAKRELACALPFIEPNDEVARYRVKIEQTRALR